MQRGLKATIRKKGKKRKDLVSMQRGLKVYFNGFNRNRCPILSQCKEDWKIPESQLPGLFSTLVSMQRGLKVFLFSLPFSLTGIVSMQRGLKVTTWKHSKTLFQSSSQCKEDWKLCKDRSSGTDCKLSQCKEDWKFPQYQAVEGISPSLNAKRIESCI